MKLVYIALIAFGFLAGTVQYRRISQMHIRWFVPFLGYTFLVELFSYLNLVVINNSNHWWYNIYTVFEFSFLSYVFFHEIQQSRLKKIIIIVSSCVIGLSVFNILFFQGWNNFHTITYRVGSLMIITWCFIYFRQLLNKEDDFSPLKIPMFWVATGLLFFFIGFFIYINVFDFIAYAKIKAYGHLFQSISNILNILLYALIITGLYFSWQTKT